ncbi:unnamed protein product [Darwinula stevensoni]|uniref:26S proteasome non-ATPase regulatory subunit 5 n=1 Tax=Darwinula stevensoni TaxID=69355 RepID=A0A7R9FSQ3_9CRUS|nr:unnamed protein product [Darwinula stevensoni]CAG0903628.1 unnamed protein product [Darwinula stevensoni]
MLTELALTPHGLHYLEDRNVLKDLEKILNTSDGDPLRSFLVPGAVKFFGNVARLKPEEILDRYPQFIANINSFVRSDDLGLKHVAVDTFGFVGSTPKGKLALQRIDMKQLLQDLSHLAEDASTETRTRAMNTIASLLSLNVENSNNELENLTESWFRHLSKDPMQFCLSLCKQPFTDIRTAALKILQVIASQHWGQVYIKNTPGCLEYILDRRTEHEKAGKEGKYEVVSSIVSSPTALTVGDPLAMKRMDTFRYPLNLDEDSSDDEDATGVTSGTTEEDTLSIQENPPRETLENDSRQTNPEIEHIPNEELFVVDSRAPTVLCATSSHSDSDTDEEQGDESLDPIQQQKKEEKRTVKLSSSLQVSRKLKKHLYINPTPTEGWKSTSQLKSLAKKLCKPDELMKNSVIQPGFEQKEAVPSYSESRRKLAMLRKIERAKTKGEKWFHLPATELTNEIKRDLEVIQMQNVLDPKRFYKKNDLKALPKYFQIGKVVEGPADFYHARIPKKERKRTIVEELLADSEFQRYRKRKMAEIESKKRRRPTGAHRHAKRLKQKKKR